MSVGAVGGYTAYFPITNSSRLPVANNQQPIEQPTQPVQPVVADADGDNDGSKGRFVDTYA